MALADNNGEQRTAPPTLLSVHRDSDDSEGEVQAASSCVQSSSDENELVFRADVMTPLPISAEDSRWQAFRNRIRSKTLQKRRGLGKGDKKVIVPWRKLLARREIWAIIISQVKKEREKKREKGRKKRERGKKGNREARNSIFEESQMIQRMSGTNEHQFLQNSIY